MYSNEAIETITNRVGWSDLSSGLPFALASEIKTGTSGKTFNSFHPLVLVETIYAAVPEVNMSEEDFNQYLTDVRKQETLKVLTSILDFHADYDPAKDYSRTISERSALFDDAIGYAVAINILGLYLSTSRSNFQERNAKLSYQSLKVELEGAKNESGHTIAKGIVSKYDQSIKKAQKVIFPFQVIVTSEQVW